MGGPARAIEKVGSGIESVVSGVGKTVEAIAEDPLPFIATVALIYVGVPPELAAAAVTAANGGDMDEIVTSAATAYVGGQAGQYAGSSAASAGSSATTAKIAADAAGASVTTTLRELDSGKSFDEALDAGLKSAVVAGGTTAVIETGKSAIPAPPETGQGIKAVPGKGTNLAGDQSKVSGTGLTDKVPTGGGQGLTVDPSSTLYASQFTPSTGRVRGTEEGGLQPAYRSGSDYLTPDSFDTSIAPSTPYKEPRTVTQTPEPVISKTTEMLARPIIAGGLSELFGFGPKVPGAPSVGDSSGIAQTTTTGTTVGLTGTGGAGEIESKESGKKRSNVWNEESLRLKDALGV